LKFFIFSRVNFNRRNKPLNFTTFVALNFQIRKKLTLGIIISGGNILEGEKN
jgi:hypothetical protein